MWYVLVTMGPWEIIYVLVGLFVASMAIMMYWLYSTKTGTKNNYLQQSEVYGNRFEYGDPRCGKCVKIINENSVEICNCLCHTENSTYTKYHESEIAIN